MNSNSAKHYDDELNIFQTLPKIYSFDADFQLVRKASSGKQWAEPKHSNKFFLDQASVDAFMGNYYEDRGKPDVVNSFL